MPCKHARRAAAALTLAALCATPLLAQPATQPAPSRLLEGSLTEAVATLTRASNQAGDSARFALGTAQTLHAVERMSGTLYKYGLRDKGLGEMLPFLRLPVPVNPNPEPVSADALDAMLAQFVADLNVATDTLAQVKDPNVKLPVRVGLVRIDLNGDAPGGDVELYKAVQSLGFIEQATREGAEQFSVSFDVGDARWLEGYCHLLSAMAEMAQAYDKRELIERTGHLFFDRVAGPHNALVDGAKVYPITDQIDVADAIAFVHLLNLPVRDAAKMRAAREHLKQTFALSRASWAAIRAETDDDDEWIPNEHQATVVPRMQVSAEIIDGWLRFVDEMDACLDGNKLLPFWRNKEGDRRGVNARRVFEEPTPFDLVLWVQGTAATPYIENGEVLDSATYRRLERLLGGDFLTFAAWVN